MVAKLDDLPIRDDLKGRKPYGAPQLAVPVALNVNENTHRIPEEVAVDIIGRLAAAVLDINRYPDREFLALRNALANYLGADLKAENIWAANGSNEVLQHIFQAFGGPGRSSLGFGPTYSMYALIAQGTGTIYVDAPRLDRYELSPELIREAILEHKPNIVMLCSPNNPTGTPLSLSCIEAAYEAVTEATGGVVVVDEAYAEFGGNTEVSAINLLEGRERLLISRTMSKAFAFAGARVGYLAADPAVIDALRLVRLPYHLSSFTQAAAEAALDHASTMLATVNDIRFQRDRIMLELKDLGLDPYRSDSNFVLFGGLEDPNGVFEALLAKGVLIRNVGIPGTLRVSAGTEAETSAFLEALRQVLKK
ncbi:histidinol-phosphate transaminase [Rhodoluna lacicola]|uniref:Histidinol-phosphate aminotransferase n=1 Tax=Rhodoluna lacicola TaxID=529884 RepID=A0A060JEW8_9MICO|nr:histidinol-phosphate transaminase [Rhodoluna lacicola]AIC47305.1 histidinol-phosphate aminotransferase [Rhodoluna lacicola]